MRVLIDVTVEPEDETTELDPEEVAKDLKLYLIDYTLIMTAVEISDIVGGFHVIAVRAEAS